MLAPSPKDRSRSPHRTNGAHVTNSSTKPAQDTSSTVSNNNKTKKDNESQSRMKTLKSFIQILITDASSLGSTYEEQVKGLENACMKEFQDLSLDRIRRMIRSVFKGRQYHQASHTTNSLLHQEHPPMATERFNSNEANSKKSRPNSTSNNASAKTPSELIPSSSSGMSALDADFLRHAFSQQFRPSMDLSAYFSAAAAAATTSNGTSPAAASSLLFRPNFSPANFLQSLTTPPPPLPTTASTSSHAHTNGSYPRGNESPVPNVNKLSKQVKLSTNESNSIKILVNAYREAASYLNRSADELELLT